MTVRYSTVALERNGTVRRRRSVLMGWGIAFGVVVWAAGSSGGLAVAPANNGHFDEGIQGWQLSTVGQVSWSSEDSHGSPNSGSMQLTASPGAFATSSAFANQCVGEVAPGQKFTFSANLKFPSSQAAPGFAQTHIRSFAGPNCSGTSTGGFGALPGFTATNRVSAGDWLAKSAQYTVPAGTVSARIDIYVQADVVLQPGQSLVVLVDDIAFTEGARIWLPLVAKD